jgi:hypothetical protein
MRRILSRLLILPALCAASVPAAHAARPFVTDDARLTTAGSCQLESWTRVYRDSKEFWALPACNPGGQFELTAGGGRARVEGEASTSDYIVQGKTLFRPLTSNGWGWGLAAGKVVHPGVNPGPNLLGNSYVYLPASFSFNDDRLVVHANLGMLRDRATHRNSMTWGLGGEFQLSPRLLGIAETFGDSRHNPYWQIGARYSIVPDRVQIDATLGQQVGGPIASRWISFGLRLTPDRLF